MCCVDRESVCLCGSGVVTLIHFLSEKVDIIIGASAASPYLVNPTSTLSVVIYMSWTGSILASKDDALYRVDYYVS